LERPLQADSEEVALAVQREEGAVLAEGQGQSLSTAAEAGTEQNTYATETTEAGGNGKSVETTAQAEGRPAEHVCHVQ